jgi:hypothetical protein
MDTRLDQAAIKALASQYAPGMENAIAALSMIESSGGLNEAAYKPNKVGAIGPLQILSKQLGGKYGNFEQYAAPGMTDPLNPTHSTVAGIRMFAELMKKNEGKAGQDGAVLEYFTGTPTPNPNRTDGLTTAANYLQKFNRALNGGGAGRGFVNPPMVNGILPGETGGMPDAVLREANLPALATPGINPAASSLDVPALLRRAIEGVSANASANRKSMGTFGVDDQQADSAVVAGGDSTAGNIKAMADIFARSNARFSGEGFDAKNPLERLVDQVFGGFKDKAAFKRAQGQLTAMQAALGGQQKLAGNQQTLNAGTAEDITKLAGIAAQLEGREQAAAASVERAQLLADSRKEVQQLKTGQVSGVDKLLQDAATRLGMTIPQGVKPSEYAKVLGPETLAVLQSVAAGGSIAANPVDATFALDNPSLPASVRAQGEPIAAFVNAAANSPEFKKQLKGYIPGDKASEAMRQQQLKRFVQQSLGEVSKGGAAGFTLPKGVSNPYDNYGGGLRAEFAKRNLPDPSDNISALNTLIKSQLPDAEIAAIYKSAIASNQFDLFGAPKQQAVFWKDSNVNGGKALDLTLPQNISLLRAANIAAARKQAEAPAAFYSLETMFNAPAGLSEVIAP